MGFLAALEWHGFLRDIATQFIAGALLLAGAYFVIDKRVHVREALDRQRERTSQNEHNRRASLEAVHVELESNASALSTALNALRRDEISYPLFDTTTLALAFEPVIFTTLETSTVKALLQVRNRMETANEQHALVFDLRHGPTVILTTMTHAAAGESPMTSEAAANFIAHRNDMTMGLIQRLENIGPYVDAAIDAVEAELGIEAAELASERSYRPHEPIGRVGP